MRIGPERSAAGGRRMTLWPLMDRWHTSSVPTTGMPRQRFGTTCQKRMGLRTSMMSQDISRLPAGSARSGPCRYVTAIKAIANQDW